ncbi:MAG: Bug family tripartite tricarboxylate transporter substrate binding protein [Aminivibrio sp.]|jgi:tripartite-type tricarboxylate transporter receptor subunit TctC
MTTFKKAMIITLALTLFFSLGFTNKPAEANSAENYPDKPIKLVIPYPPGGATDIIYRIVAEYAQQELGQPIAVINMGGASGTIGSRNVKDSAPDGYTILGSHDVIATAYYSQVVDYAFDAFEPVCLLTSTPNIATTNSREPWQNMSELLKDATSRPGEIVWSVTLGSTDHFFLMGLLDAAGLTTDVLRIAGYDGTGPQITALLGGHTNACMTNVTSGYSYVKSGDLRFLGVAHPTRMSHIPDVPTMRELGIPFDHGTNRGVFLPKGTPVEIINKLAGVFEKVLQHPDVQKKINDLGTIVNFIGPAEYKVFLDDTMVLYGKLSEIADR